MQTDTSSCVPNKDCWITVALQPAHVNAAAAAGAAAAAAFQL